jgi:hypothetical protein
MSCVTAFVGGTEGFAPRRLADVSGESLSATNPLRTRRTGPRICLALPEAATGPSAKGAQIATTGRRTPKGHRTQSGPRPAAARSNEKPGHSGRHVLHRRGKEVRLRDEMHLA